MEGTGDELAIHTEEIRAYNRLRLIVEPEENTGEPKSQTVTPNEGMLAAIAKIAELNEGRPFSDDSNTQRLLKEAHACRRSADGLYLALAEELSQTCPTVLLTYDEDMSKQATKNVSFLSSHSSLPLNGFFTNKG